MSKLPLYVRGMHGIGDNIHQRAVIRLLKQTHSVTLESSWHSLYHDLLDDDFRIVGRGVALRTQQKNAMREHDKFAPRVPPHHVMNAINLSYNGGLIANTASKTITEVLLERAGIRGRFHEADFRLPIKPEWNAEAARIMSEWQTGGRPIMIYRPLCVRPEWIGSEVRNANADQYLEIATTLKRKYFAVSVADLEAGKEWIDGPIFPADMAYHRGEFVFEILAAVMRRADLVLTSGGFAAMLGPAVETPTISILGGYEPKEWCGDGAKFSPYLCIEPIQPCHCGSSGCKRQCPKTLDMPAALAAIADFTSMVAETPIAAPAIVEKERTMLELPSVSLLCVETQMHEMARRAVTQCMSKVKFAEVVIHTDKPDLIPVEGARYVTVPNWPIKTECGTYCYNDAPKSISTDHMLFLEWDGAVREPAMWDNHFLTYDYIGAPWPGRAAGQWDPKGFSVGNGGFTLWSKRLMNFVSANRARFPIFTDVHISKDHRDKIVAEGGFRWAPEAIGYNFSYEHGIEAQRIKPSFGVHDVFNWPLALPKEEIVERAKLLMLDPYVKRTSKLYSMAQRAPYLRSEIPGYEEAMTGYRQPDREETAARRRRDAALLQRGVPAINRQHRPLPHHYPMPQVPPKNPDRITRETYEKAMQARGLKA